MNLDDFEGHTPIWYLYGEVGAWWVQSDFTTHDDFIVAEVRSQNEVDAKLIAAAPDLLAEVKRLRERIDEFGLAVTDMLPMWEPGDYDEMEINGKRKIVVDEDWWRWMATHIETLLYPIRYHVEGKRYNHDTCKWEKEE